MKRLIKFAKAFGLSYILVWTVILTSVPELTNAQMCSSYTTWTSGMWIGPGAHCGSPYGGTTVTSGGRLYTHRGYCSKTGPGTWDFQDAGGCTSCTDRTVGSASSSPTVCQNSVMTSITHTTTQVTGIASSSGLPSGVSASYASNTITISGTPSASGTFNYTITPTSSCGSAVATGTITVTVLPTITSSNGASRCGIGTLGIDASASSGSIEWYTASSDGSSLGSSSSGVDWTTPSISSTTIYYAEADNGTCTSASRTAVTATVNSIPTVSGSVSGARCNSGTVEIQATASAGSIDWYTLSSGGSSAGSSSSGVNWTTPSISSTTTYYAEAVNGSCISASRTAVTATVNTASAGPGGITDELFLWLKSDAGTGSIGTSWEDQSCNGFDYATVSGPTKETEDWNFNPAIEILSGGFNAPSGSELGDDWTVFFVSKLMSSDTDGRLFDAHSGNYLWGYHGGYRNGLYMNASPSSHNSGIATTSGLTNAHVFTYMRENSGATIDARVDGDALATYSSTNSASGQRIDINQGLYGGSQSSDSRIGEFIIFNKELSDSEIMKVESYLASKYGVALSDADGSTGGDYVSTSGATYWDASSSSGYENDIIVIGKDANTQLEQKQAKSEDDSLTIFISSLAADNSTNAGTVTNDESFIAIGHNGGRLKSNTGSFVEKPLGIATRFDREWKITNTNFVDNFSLEFEWDSTGTFDINDTRLLVDDDGDFSDATIYSVSDGLTFSIGSIVIGGIGTSIIPSGSTKYITVASADPLTTLPVELLYFNATKIGDYVLCEWETAAEVNNDYFIVQRSFDMDSWEEVGFIQGGGNSHSPISYSLADPNDFTGVCYYRLIQVDFDGASETFDAVLVNGGGESEGCNICITVNPNPINEEAKVKYTVSKAGKYVLHIFDNNGRLVANKDLSGVPGDNYCSINTSHFNSGSYLFVLKGKANEQDQTLVLKP